jgi:hypothetical protein
MNFVSKKLSSVKLQLQTCHSPILEEKHYGHKTFLKYTVLLEYYPMMNPKGYLKNQIQSL